MAYFHVLVKFGAENSNSEQIFSDLSEKELQERFVTPYRKGNNILTNDRLIDFSRVLNISIIRTCQTNNDTRDQINEDSLNKIDEINRQSSSLTMLSPGSGYDPEDLLKVGENVTSNYLTSPPGAGINVESILRHPLVVTVIGGLIVGLILAQLGFG